MNTTVSTRGRPKSDQKRDQILAAAGDLFTEFGYGQTNLDQVARAAEVSKQTIYSHFEGKADLLKHCIEKRCRDGMLSDGDFDFELPPADFLKIFAERFVNTLCDPRPLKMNRLCLSESERHPEVGESFFSSGPKLVMAALTKYFVAATSRGQLQIEMPELAAAQFTFMLKGIAMDTHLLNLPEWPYTFSQQQYVQESCLMFVRAHQPR